MTCVCCCLLGVDVATVYEVGNAAEATKAIKAVIEAVKQG